MTTTEATTITEIELCTVAYDLGQERHTLQVVETGDPVGEREEIGSASPAETERHELGFDYAVVDDEIAEKMRSAAERVHSLARAAVVEVGAELLAVKGQIGHGHFTHWVERECGMSIRAAQRAMAAAEMVSKNDKLSYLPADGLLALAGRSVPEPIVAEIIGRVNAGEQPTNSEIKAEIAAAKEAARRAAEEAKLIPRQRSARERHKATSAARKDTWAERHAAAKAAAGAAAKMMAAALGDRLAEFVELFNKADTWTLVAALRAEVGDLKPSSADAGTLLTSEDAEVCKDTDETDDETQMPLPFAPSAGPALVGLSSIL